MVLGCQEPYRAIRDSEQKRVIEGRPITLAMLNKNLSEAKLVIFTDLASNMTIVVYEGKVWAVSRSSSGTLNRPTLPGIYTVHLIDYCPPWPSGLTEEAKKPCSTTNRLGMIAFWYKGKYLIGVHTRYFEDSRAEFSNYPLASQRRGRTHGCIAAPHDLLEKILFELILTDPAFSVKDKDGKVVDVHPAATTMKEYNEDKTKEKTKKTAAVRLIDFQDKTIGPVRWEKGDPVSFDMRVVVIDSSHRDWIKLKNQEDFKEHQAIFKFFDPTYSDDREAPSHKFVADHPEISYGAVTNCTAEKDIPLFKSNDSFHPNNMISTIKKGAQLKEVYLWPVNAANTPVELELGDTRLPSATSGWVQNLDGLKCSKDIYWSYKRPSPKSKK